ncbi:DBR1 domain-containing protein [Mycena venus]|uniref:DBR1 domain-containing protein n=1 Tax=Mycena venus TaxID=2733690 RepID=A0A8H6XKN0_9AGAR|nr:DBR1 domain-containing protein [Mycena venus]
MDTRPPPPQGAPRFGFNRVYRTNLRPVVIAVGLFSALWSLLSGIGFFRSINTDKQEGVPKLATFAIVLGTVYMVGFLIETIGVISAVSQRLALVRIYAYLTLVAIVLTTGGGIFEVVVHFTSKSDILKECTDLTNGSRIAVYPFGFFGPSSHEIIDAEDAAAWCKDAYDRNSWQDIVSLLVSIFLAVCFSMLAWGYYRQVLDPTSVVNFARAPSHRFNAYPMHSQPYNASVPNLGYNAPYGAPQQTYAPAPRRTPDLARRGQAWVRYRA